MDHNHTIQKTLRTLQIGLALLIGIVYLPLSSAAQQPGKPVEVPVGSPSIVLMQVQAASALSASDELIVLYNQSSEDIDVTDWCLDYMSASTKTTTELACITPQDNATQLWVESGGLISFASTSFVLANPAFIADFVFNSGMNADSGHVVLKDADERVVDLVGWGQATAPETAPAQAPKKSVLTRSFDNLVLDTDNNEIDFSLGETLQFIESGIYEVEIIVDVCINIDGLQTSIPDGMLLDENDLCQVDLCPDLDGLQVTAPVGYEKLPGNTVCTLIPLEDAVILLTELLPNAPGYDTGNEFIELYNPNSRAIDIAGYHIQVGPSYIKSVSLAKAIIQPKSYIVLSDTQTGITLANATGASLRLVTPAGSVVSQSPGYSNAADDVSWADIEGQWIYTNQITPGSANKPFLEPSVDEVLGITSVLAPCPAGKFRNPATNRCKSSESAVSQLTPCDSDEYRNPETNRCRKLSSTDEGLKPCDAGKERNPETNRCRLIASSLDGDDLSSIIDIPTEQISGSVNWPVLLAAIGATTGYMLYEWRVEFRHGYSRLQRKLVQ